MKGITLLGIVFGLVLLFGCTSQAPELTFSDSVEPGGIIGCTFELDTEGTLYFEVESSQNFAYRMVDEIGSGKSSYSGTFAVTSDDVGKPLNMLFNDAKDTVTVMSNYEVSCS